jgi:putative ABC transport system substrate-binding protein
VKRREFIAALSGAMAQPFVARAQQAVPLIGFLMSRSAADSTHLADAFRASLRDGGFNEGTNVKIEYRWADGDFTRLPAMAKELAGMPLAVLVAVGGNPSVMAAKAATSTIPMVFAMSEDPIKSGLAKSFNRPGGNATGVSVLATALEPKRLGLLHELVPKATNVAAFAHTHFPGAEGQVQDMQAAAPQVGLTLRIMHIGGDADIERAFDTIARERMDALAVAGSPFFDTRRELIATLAARARVPAIYHFREYAVSGGLISYGTDIRDVYRHLGRYTAQILKGTKPGDLPILLPSKFELVINLKAAKALGLEIPPTLLARADEVIE